MPLSAPLNGSNLVHGTSYSDIGLTNGQTYYYAVTAVDISTNESVASNEVVATPMDSLGAALMFDGVNDYIGNITDSGFPGGSSDRTFAAWFKFPVTHSIIPQI